MSRPILAEAQIHPAIRDKVATRNSDIVREVQQALTENAVVVVGMRQNRLIVSGELSRLLTKQSNNAS